MLFAARCYHGHMGAYCVTARHTTPVTLIHDMHCLPSRVPQDTSRPAAARRPARVTRMCRHRVQASAPNWNPQNVPDPKVMPSLEFSPLEALQAQLDAISNNDHPWENHGVQTMYEFAEEAGSMERSRYFGFSKDLYHFDHFLVFKTKCAALVDCQAYQLLPGPPEAVVQQQQHILLPEIEAFYVSVTDSQGRDGGVFEFKMVQREMGLRKGCWMTKSCIKVA